MLCALLIWTCQSGDNASLQAVVTQVNLACQVVADAAEAHDRVKQHLSMGGGFGSSASLLSGRNMQTKKARAAAAATAQLATFNRLAVEAGQAVTKAGDMLQVCEPMRTGCATVAACPV